MSRNSLGLKHLTAVEIVSRLALLAAISILVGTVLPGAVAYEAGVFDMESLRQRVKARQPDAFAILSQYENSQSQTRKALASLDAQVAAAAILPANVASLRQAYVQEFSKSAPISIQPFGFHLVVYFWPIMYFGLGTAIIIIRPSIEHDLRHDMNWPTVWLALGIFAFSVGPLMLRTLGAGGRSSGRTVYAWTNPDLSPVSFLTQVFMFAVFSFCLAVIWSQWSSFSEAHRIVLMKEETDGANVSIGLVNELSRLLYRWQVTFLAISVGFVIYTAVFWNQIVRNRDFRFCLEAIMAHAFWIVTIVITVSPLVATWRLWHQQKLSAVAALINESKGSSQNLEAKIAAIQDLQPIPGWNLTASAAAVVTSLAGLCIQALIK